MSKQLKSILFVVVILLIVVIVILLGKGETKNIDDSIKLSVIDIKQNEKEFDLLLLRKGEIESDYAKAESELTQKNDSIYLLKKQIKMLELKNQDLLNYQEYLDSNARFHLAEKKKFFELNQQLADDLAYYMTLDAEEVQIRTEVSDKIKLEPTPYFYGYIEIISPSVSITKAVLKNREGQIVKEFRRVLHLNTQDLPSGLYYLSLYKGEKMVKMQTMYKKP